MKLALASPFLYKILLPWRKYKYLAGSLGSWTVIGYVLEYAKFLVANFAPSFVVIDVYNDNSETTNATVASFTSVEVQLSKLKLWTISFNGFAA